MDNFAISISKYFNIIFNKYFVLVITLGHNLSQCRVINVPESSLLLRYNGEELVLNSACSGGVVFRTPVLLDSVCAEESLVVRKSACYPEDYKMLKLGKLNNITCQEMLIPIQSLHFIASHKEDLPSKPAVLEETVNGQNNAIKRDAQNLIEESQILSKDQEELNNELRDKRDSTKDVADTPSTTNLPVQKKTTTQVPVKNVETNKHSNSEATKPSVPTTTLKQNIETTVHPDVTVENSTIANENIDNDEGTEVEGNATTTTEGPDTYSMEEEESDSEEEDNKSKFSFLNNHENGDGIVPSNFKDVTHEDHEDVSSENDDLVSWEDLNDVLAENEMDSSLEPGTLEYDAVSGGLDKWFSTSQSSPVFDSHVSLFKSVLASELTGGCPDPENCTMPDTGGGHISAYSFLHKYQPKTQTWYLVLEKMALIVDTLVPSSMLPNRFTHGRSRAELNELPHFKSQFFHDVLNLFGYETRSLTDEQVNVGSNGPEDKEFWEESILGGLESCREKAHEVHKRIFMTRRNISKCDNTAELEAIHLTMPVWDDMTKRYNTFALTINYTHLVDPNSYLPPQMGRINPRSWIFGEILWYTVQASYAFCYKEFSETNPNAFMKAIAKMLKLFETDVVQDYWASGGPGGNLALYENLLPFISHSAYGSEAHSSNGNDFKRMLINLDKISYALHKESLLDNWMQKPKRRKEEKETRTSFTETNNKHRSKRDVFTDYNDDGEIVPITLKSTSTSSTSLPTFTPTLQTKVSSDQSTIQTIENLEQPIQTTEQKSITERIGTTTEDNLMTTTEFLPTTISLEEGSSLKDISTTPDLLAFKDYSYDDFSDSPIAATSKVKSVTTKTTSTSTSTTTTPHTTTTTPLPSISKLRQFEIWGGLAYCLVLKEDKEPKGDWTEVKPSLDELMESGLHCSA